MLAAVRSRAFPAINLAAAAVAGAGLFSTIGDSKVAGFAVHADATESAAPAGAELPAPAAVELPAPAAVESAAPAAVEKAAPVSVEPATPVVVEPAAPVIPRLTPKDWTPLTLLEKSQLNHNTWFFRFEASPNPDGSPLFPVASCLMTRAFVQDQKAEMKPVVRPYTPVNRDTENESVDLVIKVYPNGKMGNYMKDLNPGDTLDFKGPLSKYPYKANMKKHIGMLAAGTGITPMLQVAQKIVEDPNDDTQVSLIFANITADDILCKSELDALAAKSNGQFKVFYTIEKPKFAGVFWKGGIGRISKSLIEKLVASPGDDTLVMVCGPPGFMEVMSGNKTPDRKQGELKGYLKDLGYTAEQVFKF